jgi:hypothetical protein
VPAFNEASVGPDRVKTFGVAVLVTVRGVLSMKAVKSAAVMPVAFAGARATEIEAVWPKMIDGAVMERLVVMEELTVYPVERLWLSNITEAVFELALEGVSVAVDTPAEEKGSEAIVSPKTFVE